MIDSSIKPLWNHGDPLKEREAEKMLKAAPANTWLLRYSQFRHCYVITKKTDQKLYERVSLRDLPQEDVEKIKNGYSLKYPINEMLLTKDILKRVHFNYGDLSENEVKLTLNDAPIGSWILINSSKFEGGLICVKVGVEGNNATLRNFKIGSHIRQKGGFSIDEIIQDIENKTNKNLETPIKLEAYGIGSKQRQIRLTVNYLYFKQSLKQWEDFEHEGYIKLSRKQAENFLPTSYILKQVGHHDVPNLLLSAKIFKVVHGTEGILGKGGMKVAKILVGIETGDYLVKSKFITLKEQDLLDQYPEMKGILLLLEREKTPHVATGDIVIFEDKNGNRIPSLIGERAERDLRQLLHEYEIDYPKKIEFAKQMLTGLAAVHELNIAHCDLKPENIWIYSDPSTHKIILKIADWDYAIRSATCDRQGTPPYMAPELRNSEDRKSLSEFQIGDIFSMGMILFYLFNGQHLWDDEVMPSVEEDQTFHDLMGLTPEVFATVYPEPPKDTIEHLIWEMISFNPIKRPTAGEALERLDKLT